jgi:hypothetical protein
MKEREGGGKGRGEGKRGEGRFKNKLIGVHLENSF